VLYEGDLEMVRRVVAYLFGDDDVMKLPGFTMADAKRVEQIFVDCFRSFGMEFDPFQITDTLEGVEFLGFKFHLHEMGWIPQYNAERLLASFCYTIQKRIDNSSSLSKAWTLCVMAAGGDRNTFDLMSTAVQHFLLSLRDENDPTILAFCAVGAPVYEDCIRFFLGYEGGADMTLFDEHVEADFRLWR